MGRPDPTLLTALVESAKKSWEKTSCTWIDMKQRYYIIFIAHSFGSVVFLQSIEISKERKMKDTTHPGLRTIIRNLSLIHI